MLSMFLKGFILGFSIAAPVGPIGLLCIRRSITLSRWHGFATGLGAATADAMYGCIAAFGLTAVSAILISQKFWVQVIGAIFLAYLGIKIFLSQPPEQNAQTKPESILNSYLSSLFLTITNPLTILAFAAAFAGLGLVIAERNFLYSTVMVIGVFSGSCLWWLILSGISAKIKHKINPNYLHRINQLSGVILVCFAAYALYLGFFHG